MKILDRYILTSFVTTFATVFTILFFIFLLQTVWLFIAELAGKDLDVWLIIKFLLYYSPKMIPLVLPLSILLASIMTFGNFAENYEFAAMKSSGISLSRAMRGLTIFIFVLSIVSFFFANSIIPKADYKFTNLRKNIIQRKPAMAIAAGQFNAIGENFNIKVDKKSGDNGEKLTNVTIHKRNVDKSYATVIRSKRGLLKSSESSNLLQLELFDGYYYEELKSKNPRERLTLPFVKSSFSKQIMNIDLSKFNSGDMDEQKISQTNSMLNIKELNYTLDSLNNNYNQESKTIAENLVVRTSTTINQKKYLVKATFNQSKDSTNIKPEKKEKKDTKDLLALIEPKARQNILNMAVNNYDNYTNNLNFAEATLFEKTKNINNHWLALYDKFVIAYACLLMFFIGAPLGAIIRKGGVGLPIVFAVIIFIIFHFINTFGKKLAQENGITPFLGAWMSSFVLTPLAITLTYRATNDMGMFSLYNIYNPVVVVFKKIFKIKPKEEE